jgi:hypothetical protein
LLAFTARSCAAVTVTEVGGACNNVAACKSEAARQTNLMKSVRAALRWMLTNEAAIKAKVAESA